MNESHRPGLLERSLAPWPLLLGVVTAFLACCLAGRVLGRRNCFDRFDRFHYLMDYITLYYPTTSQVQSLARETFDPAKVAVIVGGNSIMYGGGSDPEHMFTRYLQAELGDEYRVLNLAMPGEMPFEFGATAAEFLVRDYPKLILVTNTWIGPGTDAGDPDGRPELRYFFEEARARGLLMDCPEREARLRELEQQRQKDPSALELKAQLRVDGPLYFRDLWNVFTYQHLTTVWCNPLAGSWWRPRRDYPDPDKLAPPVDEATQRSLCGTYLPQLRAQIEGNRPYVRPAPGQALPPCPLERSVKACLPGPLRERTLVLVNRCCPYFLEQLTPQERGLYGETVLATVQALERAGVNALDPGRSLSTRHYGDVVHLTAEGGRRMAEEAAPKVREMARRLGYVAQGRAGPGRK
ncbi:MAG: hypothetical protein HYS12_13525 [Planctomycetes bacterium]|nr:hypothetical protein [Planctomycetota bacterium]